jgi:Ca2+-binding RTX toxin-like protein
MAILEVPSLLYPTIADAMAAAQEFDTINVAAGYGPEAVIVTVDNITITGPDTATGIDLTIGAGVTGLVLGGTAPINVTDSGTADTITGNAGDNTITVTGGIDTVDGGAGDDRLVVDYTSSDAAVTATTTSFTGGPGTVSIAAGSIEHFTVLTGDGVDTITLTTADGNNYIDTGEGASTVVVGHGDNVVVGGSDIDTLTFGNGNNTIDAGYGTIGANTIVGGSGNNTYLGSDGIDTVTLGGGDNRIVAGDGANTITVGPTFNGDNVIIGGSGIDTITVGGGDNCIDAGFGTAGANTITASSTGTGNNSILGSDGIDTIVVGHGHNYIAAGDGANTITAGSGNNFITAGDGIDTITAMGGNNVIEAGDIGVNTVTTGIGNDVVETGGAADVIVTGAGDDIIKDAGGAGSVAAGDGHDRLIYDFSASTAPVTNTIIDVAGTSSGVMGATTYSGIEEFHVTGGSSADIITTGAGADVLDGGAGADTLTAGGGSDVIYGTVGDDIVGGEDLDGKDHDVLVLNGLGAGTFSYDVAGSTEDGTFTLNGGGGSISFTGIESVVFNATVITTPEDTPLVGNLGVSVSTFEVGNAAYTAGDTASRTEGDLTVNADGTYTFTPAPNYNGPAPVISYTDSSNVTTSLFIEVTPMGEMVPHCFTGEAPTVTITEDANNDGQIDQTELSGLVNVQIALPGGAFAGDTLKITNPNGTTTNKVLSVDDIVAGEVLVDYTAPAVGQTITVSAEIDSIVGTSGTGTDSAAIVCFVQGTLITTADGQTPVEDLKVGDLVQTLDRGFQPMRWVGRRHVDAIELAENENLRPIRIRKNVVCAEKGVGDLVVSPQHRILVASKVAQRMFGNTEVLVPAKQLLAIEGVEIADDLEDVTYFHILFDQHEIVYANGVPSESLYLGHVALRSLTPAGREEIHALFPEVASPTFMPTLCRPIIPNKRARQLAQRLASNGKPLLDAQSAHHQPKMLGGVAA